VTAKNRLYIRSSWKKCRRCSTERTRSSPAYCPPQKQHSSFTAIHSFTQYRRKRLHDQRPQALKYPVSLYLVVPPSDIERLKPLLRLIFTMTVNRLTEELEEVRNSRLQQTSSLERHSRPARTTASCFSSTNSQHWERCLSSRRFCLHRRFRHQSVPDYTRHRTDEDTYGNHESIISNCHIRIAFAPIRPRLRKHFPKWRERPPSSERPSATAARAQGPLATNVSTNVDHISRLSSLSMNSCAFQDPSRKDREKPSAS